MPNIPTNKAPGVSLIVVRFSNHRKISHSIYIGSTTTRKIRNGCTSAGALTSTTEIRPHNTWIRFFHKRFEFTEAIKVLRNSQGADPVQAERAEDKGDCSCPPATDWKTG